MIKHSSLEAVVAAEKPDQKLPESVKLQSFKEKLEIIKENNNQITEALAVFDGEIENFTQLQNDVLELLKARLLKLKG